MPNWDESHWNWTSLADADGHLGVVVALRPGSGGTSATIDDILAGKSDVFGSKRVLDELRLGVRDRYSHAMTGFSAEVDASIVPELLKEFPSLEVYPDYQVKATSADNIVQVGADQMWTRTDSTGSHVTGKGIVIAEIDTGIFYNHPDLGGGYGPSYKVIGGYDFVNYDNNPVDDNGHGTHVAGIIAANGAIKGVAPDAKLLAYKVLGADGSGSMSTVVAAVDRAMDPNQDGDTSDHADVISMSLGGPGEVDDPICVAIGRAVEIGIVVVVAAGNSGPALGSVDSPGISPDAITVGAVDAAGALADFSSRGTNPELEMKPELSAPGVAVNSTVPYSGTRISSSTGYMSLSGTSMATPHVSGGVALLKQLHPGWTPAQIKSALVTGAAQIDEPFWFAGAGQEWLPAAADTGLFTSAPLASYGLANGQLFNMTLYSSGGTFDLAIDPTDCHVVEGNESLAVPYWTNMARVAPTSAHISQGAQAIIALTVSSTSSDNPEGYYDGIIRVHGGGQSIDIRFGFVILSRISVHVINIDGREVFDPIGGVWVYSIPDANLATGKTAGATPAPPATFLLPAGNYSVHAMGHQLIYHYSDPYVLSSIISLGRLQDSEVYLRMADAHAMVLDLQTSDHLPIYVNDYRVYWRFEGEKNVSYHLVGSDYSILGSALFTLQKSATVYVSDTAATVGISIAGFAYTRDMWNFFLHNWQHWYEYVSTTEVDFHIEASADLQYLLSWEFHGVNSTTSELLSMDPNKSSVFYSKYDIPGTLLNPWCEWGEHSPVGGDATFYVRRSTDTSLNSFFSGLTRTTFVQGPFTELYYPQYIFDGYVEREYYVSDYSHLKRAASVSEIYLPDRNFLGSIVGVNETDRLGAGPFYPAAYTVNTNSTMVLYQPLLRDQSGAKVGGKDEPGMRLYWGGSLAGVFSLEEYLARPNAERIIPLLGSGSYSAVIDYTPFDQICSDVTLELGFTVPGTDIDPPHILGLEMPQRYAPGQTLDVLLAAVDGQSQTSVSISWRAGSADSWKSLPVAKVDSMNYSTIIQTSPTVDSVDLMIRVSDSSGNYLAYTATGAAFKEVPVTFDLSASTKEVEFRNAVTSVVLTGRLTDASGSPLSSMGRIPLELMAGQRKLGMILDDYVTQGSHVHNGSIRFEWDFNPTELFSGPNQSLDIQVSFDLGLYEPVMRTITLRSVDVQTDSPSIVLVSPSNGSLIAAGVQIDLDIRDNHSCVVEWYLDGVDRGSLSAPWILDTSSWTDGTHTLEIVATDEFMASTRASFVFAVDALAPVISILSPANGSRVPQGWQLNVSVTDAHLTDVSYSLDGGPATRFSTPFLIDMTGWPVGNHTVVVYASDEVDHHSSRSVSFEIVSGNILVTLLSPSDGAVIRSGTPIVFSVLSEDNTTSRWMESGIWHLVTTPGTISTSGWGEGSHMILLNATGELGSSSELIVTVIIDDTPPSIVLDSPSNGTFVVPTSSVKIHANDPNFMRIRWTVWGQTRSSIYPDITIYLTGPPSDGYFSVVLTSTDKAGNEGSATYVFAMDSMPPSLDVLGVTSGSAVSTGTVLNIVAEDAFLSYVGYSLDGGSWHRVSPPYALDASSFPLGWNTLSLLAEDSSGKHTYNNLSLFIDALSPSVIIKSSDQFLKGSPFEIEANVTDDFEIGVITAYYGVKSGGFMSTPMTLQGTDYVATLPPDALWDGMTVYVSATDTVGHSTESVHQKLSMMQSSQGGPGAGQDGGGGRNVAGTLNGSEWNILFILATAAAIIIAPIMYLRRRPLPSRESALTTVRLPPAAPSVATVSVAAPFVDPSRVRSSTLRRIVKSSPTCVAASTAACDSSAPKPSDKEMAVKKTLLIDAISEVFVPNPSRENGQEDTMDYGELIERELIRSSLSRSVFKDESNIQKGTAFTKLQHEQPDVVSGLQLKKLIG